MLPVQVEPFVGNVFNAADTETCGVSIYQFIIRINFRDSLVKRRTFRRPEFGCVYNKILFKRLSVIDAACILFPGNNFTFRRKNFRLYTDGCFLTGIVYLRLETYGCKILVDVRSCDLRSPYRYMDFVSHNQVYIAIQTCSRIPARRLRTVFQTHGKRIVFTVFIQ